MTSDCYPITVLPHTSRLFADYAAALTTSTASASLARFYPALASPSEAWMATASTLSPAHRARLADLLAAQNTHPAALANIELLRTGANAVVTGQQVALFGGPLLTLLKAATAIARAQQATAAGHPHVPIFWLASEDHDLAEVDHADLLAATSIETLRLDIPHAAAQPVGSLTLPASITPLLDHAAELLAHAPIADALRRAYTPGTTLARAFAAFIAEVFAPHGLIVIDASSRDLHTLAAPVLHHAIADAPALHAALLTRSAELASSGYHAQVLVAEASSTLFLLDAATGARTPLRLASDGSFRAASATLTATDLLAILRESPERLSPNALLRPVLQDFLLPTSLYIGGPAEVAYFAQSQVLYAAILGRATPIQPRLSATLIEPAIAAAMRKYEVALPQVFTQPAELAQRLGARSMSPEGKQKLAAAGNTLDRELAALTAWMHSLDPSLGASADVSASKMRYQMNRLRRLAATFELQRTSAIERRAAAISLHLYPRAHPQERLIAGVTFLARFGSSLPAALIEAAAPTRPSHLAIAL